MNLPPARFFYSSAVAAFLVTQMPPLRAEDCGCPKPKVKIREVAYSDPSVVKVFFDGKEVKPGDEVQMEREKEYPITIEDIATESYHGCQPAKLVFPHCAIEYTKDGGSRWIEGTSAQIQIELDTGTPPNVVAYHPSYVGVRITGKPSADARGCSEAPGGEANARSSAPEYGYDGQAGSPALQPPGFGLEIPMGAAITPAGYRSAGLLVNYGPLSGAAVTPDKLRYNGIQEVTASVSQHVSQNAGVITEKHYIAPEAVLRVRGWNSATQAPVNWQGAAETLVEVYAPADYTVATHAFSGQPHSFYRLEVASGDGLQPGVRLVQSNHGLETTQTMQASGDGLLLRDTDGSTITETQVIPPAQGETQWERQITVTRDAVVTSSILETHTLHAGRYVLASQTVDPGSAPNDELETRYSYYDDGRVRSVAKPDGSWSFHTYSGESTTTYSPWLSSSSLAFVNNEWSLPSSGYVVKTVSSASAASPSSSSSIVEMAAGLEYFVASLSSYSTSTDTYSTTGYKRSTRSEERGDGAMPKSYTLDLADDAGDPFLSGRTVMSWDSTGRATLYQYEKGNWAAPVFTPDSNGAAVRTSVYSGYIASPDSFPVEADFTHVPSHSTKEVTITTSLGVVREETHVCAAAGNYQLAVAKDHEYEPDGQFRRTGTKINGIYVSRTEYVSPAITREWSEDGSMTETEVNAEGEIVRRTTSGDAAVPAVTTSYDHTGLTTTTTVNNQTVSIETTDRLGRTVSSEDATGAVTTTGYDDENRATTRTAPGGVTTIETRHFDGHPVSNTGSGVVPQYYGYSLEDVLGISVPLVVTTTTIGTVGGPRVTSTSRYYDGSTATETSPDPSGTGSVTLTYGYAPTSSAPVRVHSSAAGTADRIQLDPASSAAAAMGHYSLSGMETDGNGPVIASSDRLTESSTSYVQSGGVWCRQTVTRTFHTDGSADSYTQTSLQALAPVSVSDPTYGGGLRWTSSTSNGTTTVTSHRNHFFAGVASIDSTDDSATSASPDSKSISRFGRTIFSSSYGSTAGESMTYDASGRIYQHTSATGAVTTYGYNAVGQLETTTDHEGKTTTSYYHPNTHASAGLLWQSINPAGEVTETLYNTRGQVTETTGTGTYRVTRGYNTYGEMDSMRTYRTTGSAGDLTQWTYDPATGVLKEKTDAASKKTTYTYYPNGRLFTRTWARPGTVRATYTYNDFGDLTFTNYSDTTPDVTITPDRLGRPETITDASGTRTISYHPITGATDLVAYGSGGLLPSIQIDYTQDASLRPSGYTVSGGGPSSVLGYDTAGRLSAVTASGDVHTHGYINGTGTLNSLTTTSGGNTVLTRSLYHDRMGRLRGIATANASGTPLSRHGYTLDDAGRRKTATRENGQRWDYGYDTLGQVNDAVKRFPDEAAIPGHTFSYRYDGIGNRTSATHGGTGTAVTYTPNALNQYTNISTGGGRFILGEAPAANEVTVNNLTTSRAGGLGFFWKQLTASNASGPVWSNDSVVSNGVTVTGRTWTPAASVTPAHDFDGNLTSDGRWDYLWDAENRLIQMKSTAAALAAATASGIPAQKLDFVYDAQGRRISKTVSTSTNGTTWTFLSNQRFLYDGWNLIAEYSAPSATSTTLTLQATHTWGIDLSGTPQGAGGVGGLLCTTLNSQPSTLNCFPAYDGNGNISAWIDATGTLLARMDYSPFGQLIAQYKFTPAGSTTLSRLPFGFSTKYTDAESGLLYYGFRYYDPVTGRWPSRDPIEEEGGVNLYGFVGNDGVNRLDYLGYSYATVSDVNQVIHDTRERFSQSDLVKATKYDDLLAKLRALAPFYRVGVSKRRDSFYSKAGYLSDPEIMFAAGASEATVLHELTHAYNDIASTGISYASWEDEGMAWTVSDALGHLDALKYVEKLVVDSDCSSLENVVKRNWPAYWDRRHTFSEWGDKTKVSQYLPDQSRALEKSDFENVKSHLGANFSCSVIAKALNKILRSKGCMNPCIRVSCGPPAERSVTGEAGGVTIIGTNQAIKMEY